MTVPGGRGLLRCATICASTFCITKNMPRTFTANSRSYIASSLSSSGAGRSGHARLQ
jgi:hypothetical protein